MVNLGVDNLWSFFDPPSEMHLNTPKSRTQHPDAIMGPGNQLGASGVVGCRVNTTTFLHPCRSCPLGERQPPPPEVPPARRALPLAQEGASADKRKEARGVPPSPPRQGGVSRRCLLDRPHTDPTSAAPHLGPTLCVHGLCGRGAQHPARRYFCR